MWEKQIKIVGLLALVGLGVWWCASMGRAAGKDEAKPLIGVVDTEVISDKAAPFQNERDAFKQQQDEMDKELTARVFFNAEETQQLEDLLGKTKRSADEDKKLKALIEEGLKRDRERTDLLSKTNKTQQESARLRELDALVRRNSPDIRELAQRYQEKLQKDNIAARQRLMDKVKEAAQQVGSKKGYALVVPQDIALWSNPSIDITTDVLNYLNTKK